MLQPYRHLCLCLDLDTESHHVEASHLPLCARWMCDVGLNHRHDIDLVDE
eukprot:COSAG01_NODE_36298_length_519_cov_2.357143_2_plen_49_part_01